MNLFPCECQWNIFAHKDESTCGLFFINMRKEKIGDAEACDEDDFVALVGALFDQQTFP